MSKIKLSNSDRTFFQLVADATFTNPFSTELAEIDRQISGISTTHDRKQQVSYAVGVIRERLQTLDCQSPRRFQDFDNRDTLLMRYTFLFEVYHAYAVAFDAFIQKQQTAASPPKVSFADEAIHALIGADLASPKPISTFRCFINPTVRFILLTEVWWAKAPVCVNCG